MKNIVLIALLLGIESCTPSGSPLTALTTPQFVPQSDPEALTQTGIRQDPSTGGILLQWYSQLGAAGYRVYRSDSLNQRGDPVGFELVSNVAATSFLNDTTTVDMDSIVTGIAYYYYLVAYTSDGTLSGPSDTVDYTLLDRPTLRIPTNTSVVDSSALQFQYHDNTGGGYAVIRVKDITAVPSQSVWISKRFQSFDTYPTKVYDYDGTASSPVTRGHTYQWRVERFDLDGSGRPSKGATSPWDIFTVK